MNTICEKSYFLVQKHLGLLLNTLNSFIFKLIETSICFIELTPSQRGGEADGHTDSLAKFCQMSF